jgi:hypothetical protein
MERCSSRWKCTASNLTRQLDTNPKMFTHTAADRANFRCRDIESIFVVSGAAKATQYLSDVGAWCEYRGCAVTIWSSYFEGVGNFVFMSHTKKPERAGRVR